MIEELKAIDRFICEATNFKEVCYHFSMPWNSGRKDVYVPSFVAEAKWTCDTDHMVDKWLSAQNRSDNYGWFIAFYCEMDGNNKEIMVDYILSHRENGFIK